MDVDRDYRRDDAAPTATMVARCGHADTLGYLAGTVCGPCAVAGHRKVVGR